MPSAAVRLVYVVMLSFKLEVGIVSFFVRENVYVGPKVVDQATEDVFMLSPRGMFRWIHYSVTPKV